MALMTTAAGYTTGGGYARQTTTWNGATSGGQSGKTWYLPSTTTFKFNLYTEPLDDYDYSEPDCAWYEHWKHGFEDGRKRRGIRKRYRENITADDHFGRAYKQGRKNGQEYLKMLKALRLGTK